MLSLEVKVELLNFQLEQLDVREDNVSFHSLLLEEALESLVKERGLLILVSHVSFLSGEIKVLLRSDLYELILVDIFEILERYPEKCLAQRFGRILLQIQ